MKKDKPKPPANPTDAHQEEKPKGKKGGPQPGSGRPKKQPSATLSRIEFARQADELCAKLSGEAVKWLKKAAKGGDVAAARYILDRTLGRPAAGMIDEPSRKLQAERLELEVALLKSQTKIERLRQEDAERRYGSNTPLVEEGRFYPAGGPGVGVCGRYHAALDPFLYPASPLLGFAGELCPLCGTKAPPLPPAPPRSELERLEDDGEELEAEEPDL